MTSSLLDISPGPLYIYGVRKDGEHVVLFTWTGTEQTGVYKAYRDAVQNKRDKEFVEYVAKDGPIQRSNATRVYW